MERPQYSGTKKLQKRVFDVVVSLGVLMCAAPLMILSAIAIKLTSRGPIFYCSERIGIDGTPVQDDQVPHDGGRCRQAGRPAECTQRLLRWRALQDPRGSAGDTGGPHSAALQHRRVAAVLQRPHQGHECRRSAAALRCEVDAYTEQVRRRLLVLPGITGLWQVSGRADLSWDDSVRLDLSYVENWSISSDVLIAFKTVRTVLGGAGAY